MNSGRWAGLLCWKCRSRRLKENRPWTYVLNLLRIGARRRGIPITLTGAEFKEWCRQTGYLQKRGQTPDSLTIDRIDRSQGYHIWNIRPLSHAENSDQGIDNTPRESADTDDSAPSAPEAGGENPF